MTAPADKAKRATVDVFLDKQAGLWRYVCREKRCACTALYRTRELAQHFADIHAAFDVPEHR